MIGTRQRTLRAIAGVIAFTLAAFALNARGEHHEHEARFTDDGTGWILLGDRSA